MGLLGKIFGQRFDKNNIYGIDKKEYKELKKELKQQNVDFKKSEFKEAVNNGNLSTYLDNVGVEMKTAMGLYLTPKVDSKATPEQQMAELSNFGNNFTTKGTKFEDLQDAVRLLEEYGNGDATTALYILGAGEAQNRPEITEHLKQAPEEFAQLYG